MVNRSEWLKNIPKKAVATARIKKPFPSGEVTIFTKYKNKAIMHHPMS
ncbi:hypothetical protein [Foetidibacter luteolus]|nr:hypothetical protein [Foetidibacter luteolus]